MSKSPWAGPEKPSEGRTVRLRPAVSPAVRRLGLIRLILGLASLVALAPGVLTAAPDQDPAKVGKWSDVIDFSPAVVAIHAHLLPTGKVLLWARWPTQPEKEYIDSYLWDPASAPSGRLETIPNRFANVFCSGHAFLSDGTLLVAGGHKKFDGHGYEGVTFFDPRTNQWSVGPKMNMGRWYPTACTLANGEVLVVSGSGTVGDGSAMNLLPQVWEKGGKWRDLKDAEMYMGYYPWMLSAPDGKVFWAGPQRETRYLDPAGTGKWSDKTYSTNYVGLRDYGSAVLYEPGKVLIMGGGTPTATAETIDLNASVPEWKKTGPMAFARRQLNATILPDGKVLVTGGTKYPGFNNEAGPVFEAEVWDPATGQWTTLAAMKKPRLYHSTSLLLPDGTVLSAGGGMATDDNQRPYANYPNAQIYSPPYLFKGPRPAVTSAPQTLSYGASFVVKTPDAAKIRQVTLIRLGSVTHAFDESQRFARLDFTKSADGLTVTAPATSKVCPPGPYLLFLVDEAGVPSVGRIVSLPG